jgi:hypothetical protein
VKEAEITGAIATTDKQLIGVQSALGELNLANSSQEGPQNAEDKDKALEQIKEEQIGLGSSLRLLQELLSMAQEEAISRAASESRNHRTEVTFGSQNAGLQVGISNGPISGISWGKGV